MVEVLHELLYRIVQDNIKISKYLIRFYLLFIFMIYDLFYYYFIILLFYFIVEKLNNITY